MFAALNAFQVGGSTPIFVSNVFNTTLYTGNGSTQTITNDINLSTNGGLVWIKPRSSASNHWLFDTNRGINKYLQSQNTDAESSLVNSLTAFNSNGFDLGVNGPTTSSVSYVSWTFRKQPKFFDVVTWTGNGVSGRAIAHSLASVPGCIIVKRTNAVNDWAVYQRATSATPWHDVGFLNSTSAWYIGSGQGDPYWAGIAPTSTNFYVDTAINNSGDTYVAYVFAHNAGGFGSYGSDNIISCGSYTGSNGSGQSINLGYKPQWLLVKNTSRSSTNWVLMDKYRNFDGTGYGWIYANSSSAEDSGTSDVYVYPTSTGFTTVTSNGNTDYLTDSYIYIAIKDNS